MENCIKKMIALLMIITLMTETVGWFSVDAAEVDLTAAEESITVSENTEEKADENGETNIEESNTEIQAEVDADQAIEQSDIEETLVLETVELDVDEEETDIKDPIIQETEVDMSNVTWDDVPSMGWDDPENKKCEEESAQEYTFNERIGRMSVTAQRKIKAYGIDVSSHNGVIDWKKVKAAGVDFAIIRVGGRGYGKAGTIYKDDYAKQNIEGALAAGINVGVYFFSTALNEQEALEEAKYTCSVIKDYNITYPVVFDHEGYEEPEYRNYGLSKEIRTKSAIVFLNYVESQGYKGMMYSSSSHLKDNSSWETNTLERNYDIWVAQYWLYQSEANGKWYQFSSFDMAEEKPTSYTGEYRIWQFTSEGKVDGIADHYVDMDIEYYDDGEIDSNYLDWPKISSVDAVKGGVKIIWNEVADAAGYCVYRKTNGGSWSRIATITSGDTVSYIDTAISFGENYTYTARAYSGSIMSPYKSEASIVYLQEPKITGASVVAGGVKITWEKVVGAAGYYVYRKTDGSSYSRVGQVTNGSILNYTDNTAVSGTTYTYTLLAYSGSSKSYYNSEASVMYLKDPNVTEVGATSGGVKVTWEKIDGAAGYCVYRKTNGGSWSRITSITAGDVVTYTDTTVNSGENYTYTVRAYSGSIMSGYQSQASIIYLKEPKVTGASTVAGGVKITWEKVTGAAGYYVYRKTDGSGYSRIGQVSGGSILNYTDNTAVSGTTYTYTLLAYSGGSKSYYNSQASTFYLKDPNVTGTSAVNGGVNVTWEEVAGATGYCVYRKTNGGNWSRIATIDGGTRTVYLDADVYSGTKYTYTVRAYTDDVMSGYKSQRSILYLSVPLLLKADSVNGGLKVTWNKVTGAAGYYIYRKTSGKSWQRIGEVNSVSAVSYTDKAADSGTTYIYTVRAINGASISYYDTAGISGKYTQSLTAYKTTETVNYRTGPGTSYSKVGTLKKGAKVQVVSGYSTVANGNTWFKIYLNNKYYYISSSYLKKA